MRKRARVIPKNVLVQEALRRKYVEEPWPQNLILVKSALEDNDIRVRGSVTGLFYNLSYPYLYMDSRDLAGLSDVVTEAKTKKKVAKKKVVKKVVKEVSNATVISRSTSNADRPIVVPDTGKAKPVKKRKRGRPRKSSRSKTDGQSNTGKVGGVSARDNK